MSTDAGLTTVTAGLSYLERPAVLLMSEPIESDASPTWNVL